MSRSALLALVLASCSPSWSYVQDTGSNTAMPVRVCSEISADISPAIHAWDQALRGWRPVVSSCPGDVTVVEADSGCDGSPTVIACADTVGGHVVTMIRGRYEGDAAGVFSHEFGHIMGAQHMGGTLMAANYWKGQLCPDAITIAQVASYQHANLTRFSWCY